MIERRREPRLGRLRLGKGLLAGRQIGVGKHDDRTAEILGQLAGHDDEVEALFDGGRRHHDLGRIAGRSVECGHQVALFDLGRQSGGGSAALHDDHHQRNFRHDREPQEFGLQRESRTGGHGDCGLAGVGAADGKTDGGDFIFRLMDEAADLLEIRREEVRDRSGRRDGIHGADFDPRRHERPTPCAWLPFITTSGCGATFRPGRRSAARDCRRPQR